MCVVNVLFCPSCKIYSPIFTMVLFDGNNFQANYHLVFDKMCTQFTCNIANIVNTAWVPDKKLNFPCNVCKPFECCINVIDRDCKTPLNKFCYRKIVNVWTRHYKLMDLC